MTALLISAELCRSVFLFLLISTSVCAYFQQLDVIRDNYITLAAHFTADHLHKALRSQINELLGVPVMQSIIDARTFEARSLNTSILTEVASHLDSAFLKYTNLLNETRKYVAANHRREATNFRTYRTMTECSRMSPSLLSYEEQFGTRVNLSTSCSVLNRQAVNIMYYPDKNLTSVFQSNARDCGIRWQYMIGVQGTHIEYPAHIFPAQRHRHWTSYLSAALPYKKRVLILLDAGTIQSESQLLKLKSVAKTLLDSATPGDRYMVMAAAGTDVSKVCESQNFVDASPDQISQMVESIESLKLPTNKEYSHTRALRSAYKLIADDEATYRELETNEVFHNVMFYVSRGIMSELSEAASVLAAIAEIVIETDVRVKINTLALVDDDRAPMLWSTEFLKNIAEQNFSKYKQSFSENLQHALESSKLIVRRGELVIVNESESCALTLPKVFDLLSDDFALRESSSNSEIHWSYPFSEYQSSLISLSAGIWKEHQLISVVGMDINLEVVADIIKYSDVVVMAPRKSRLRILICDLKGRVVLDSRMRSAQPWPLHIGDLEAWPVKDRWMSKQFSSVDVNKGSFNVAMKTQNKKIDLKYSWIRLNNAPLVVVLALQASSDEEKVTFLVKNSRQGYTLNNLVYHRLDVQRNPAIPYCVHVGALSSMKLGGVYLSPSCFTASAIQRPPSPQWIANYWVFLGDTFGLIRNTGIRPGVRDHVGALSGIIPYWRDKAFTVSKDYVIRRYVATSRGVMITYPASVVRDSYHPDLQPWFTRATKFPGRIVLTGPILDDEVGQIVTFSTAIFEGQAASLHNPEKDQVFAVIAMDVPIGFLANLIRSTIPICREIRRCLLFDDLGYVLTRGTEAGTFTSEPRSSGRTGTADAVERFHISHLEPLLAARLVAQSQFVEKRQCAQWTTFSLERFFQFNISFSDALTVPCDDNLETKPRSLRAEVIPVPQSNIFLALINESCAPLHQIQAFCPCSVSDRRCLLCSRFDDAECECPCQCPLAVGKQCHLNISNSSIIQASPLTLGETPQPNLAPFEECIDSDKMVSFSAQISQKAHLLKCVDTRCDDRVTLDACLGIIGCQWCVTAEDGQSALDDPFCSAVDMCYGGVKGRRVRGFIDGSAQVSGEWTMGTPVGPVAAGIMSVFLIMVMAIYCYRSQVNRLVETRSLTDSFGAPLCNVSTDDDDFQFDHNGSAVSDDKIVTLIQLASFERASNPPATVRPQYRMSPRTESSDHGYSTMTDRMAGEESECAASSVNISRQTGKPRLTTIYAPDGCCASVVITEADVHQIPNAAMLIS